MKLALKHKDKVSRKWPGLTAFIAHLGRVCCGYKLDSPVPRHHISFLHAVELVYYIHGFLIVFPVYKSSYMCSTRSIVPSCHQLEEKNTYTVSKHNNRTYVPLLVNQTPLMHLKNTTQV